MKALIIGGSGGLSGELARQLIKRNNEVWTVTRGNKKLPYGVNSVIADRNNDEQLKDELLKTGQKWDVIFDCICMNELHAKQDLELLSAFSNRFVVVSTDSVYDPYEKKVPQTEEGIFIEEEGDYKDISYGANKRRMEKVFIQSINNNDNNVKFTLFRPGHIYGEGFKLGCFPEHSRQDDLAEHILSGKPINLVGMGTYIIQPIFVGDLARVMIDAVNNEKTYNQIFCIGGPECIENKKYYEIVGRLLGCDVQIKEIPLEGYLEEHQEYLGHLCHRMYDLTKLKETGINLPATTLEEGLYIKQTVWTIKNIFEADYGCEERMPGEPVTVIVSLESDDGRCCQFEVAERWLDVWGLDEGDEWPEEIDLNDKEQLDKAKKQADWMQNYMVAIEEMDGNM